MRKTKSAILEAVDTTTEGLRKAGAIDRVTPQESGNPKLARAHVVRRSPSARLSAFYLSRDRVLTLIGAQTFPMHVLAALQGQDVTMSSAILSGAVVSYLLDAIASGGVKTLQQLAFEGALQPGSPFIYNGHFYGKGFAYSNKTPALTLTEKLDEPFAGKKLVFGFSKNGLVNDTAYTRMSGSTRLFAFGYVTDINADSIRAVPYVIGDLVDHSQLARFSSLVEAACREHLRPLGASHDLVHSLSMR